MSRKASVIDDDALESEGEEPEQPQAAADEAEDAGEGNGEPEGSKEQGEEVHCDRHLDLFASMLQLVCTLHFLFIQ